MRNYYFAFLIIFVLLVFLANSILSACNNISDTNQLSIDPQGTPTAAFDSVRLDENVNPNNNPIPDFPLHKGYTKVYSSTQYDTYISGEYGTDSFSTELITATYLITESVVETRTYNSYYMARINQEIKAITSTVNLNNPRYDNHLYSGDPSTSFWYIVDGNFVFYQSELQLDDITSSYYLAYIFPLADLPSWQPMPELPNLSRFVQDADNQCVPAGCFENCFHVVTNFLSGPEEWWFCNEVGNVREKHDHRGTPFGFETVLMHHWTSEQ